MKLGLLADIHEQTKQLREAISVLQQHGAERFVVLGDVFETGKNIEKTVRLLQDVAAVGVWGNHDVGLCFDPGKEVCQRYSAAVLDFMGSLQPHLITVGLVDWSLDRPGLTSGFVPEKIVDDLDFISVHLDPEKGKVEEALKTRAGFAVGKPVVIEETFPLKPLKALH